MNSNPSSPKLTSKAPLTAQVAQWRSYFPALEQKVHGHPLVYLDNAATSLKPHSVIEEITRYYSTINANVHRANHSLGHASTEVYEAARSRIANFIGAKDVSSIVFTKGTTDSLNFLADTLGTSFLKPGDAVLLTESEHHSNMVPWIELIAKRGIQLVYLPVDRSGHLDMEAYVDLLDSRSDIRLLTIAHSSNLTGAVHPLKEMITKAKAKGISVLVDGAQGVVHQSVNVTGLGCDFYAFSGHKLYGPMGIGVLYIHPKWFATLPPYQYGGGMISEVQFDRVTFAEEPYKYEAGTPNVAGAAGLKAAIEFLDDEIDLSAAWEHEQHLYKRLLHGVEQIEGVSVLGGGDRAQDPIVSFYVEGVHHYDLATMLDGLGVAVRAGHHCVQPLLRKWGLKGTVRASLAFYNTEAEVDYFLQSLERVLGMLQ